MIEWTDMPVTETNTLRINKFLYPHAIFSSFFAMQQEQLGWVSQKLKGLYTWDSNSTKNQDGKVVYSENRNAENLSDSGSGDPTSSTSLTDSAQQPTAKVMVDMVPSAWRNKFWTTLKSKWKPTPISTATRGSLIVSGVMGIEGPKGSLVMQVKAHYHPTDDKFESVSVGILRASPKNLSPLGGP
jgi:hypothetical protein